MPGWTLNETTDVLLKKEFDVCREQQIPHRICEEAGLDHIVPFQHEDMDKWRNSLHGGLAHQIDGTNIILHGGVDDIWYDQQTEEVIVVDYKSQANKYRVEQESYLAGVYHQSYKIQLEVYAYLLTKMGFKVSPTGYFMFVMQIETQMVFSEKCFLKRLWLLMNGTVIGSKRNFSQCLKSSTQM